MHLVIWNVPHAGWNLLDTWVNFMICIMGKYTEFTPVHIHFIKEMVHRAYFMPQMNWVHLLNVGNGLKPTQLHLLDLNCSEVTLWPNFQWWGSSLCIITYYYILNILWLRFSKVGNSWQHDLIKKNKKSFMSPHHREQEAQYIWYPIGKGKDCFSFHILLPCIKLTSVGFFFCGYFYKSSHW